MRQEFDSPYPHTKFGIMFYVYILKSKKDSELYIGSINNLKKRLAEHNSGKVESTKQRKPFVLVYYEAYLAEDDARKREAALKLRGQARQHLRKRIQKSLLQCQT